MDSFEMDKILLHMYLITFYITGKLFNDIEYY